MQTKAIATLLVMSLGLCLLGAPPASAEWFMDVFAGAAFTETSDLTLTNALGFNERLTLSHVKFDTSPSGGGRLG